MCYHRIERCYHHLTITTCCTLPHQVDRWIVRDSDSRLNPRERFAVEEWIQSGKAVHTIRDHPNHERPLNGGLWGGTKGAVSGMNNLIKQFSNKQSYGGDLQVTG